MANHAQTSFESILDTPATEVERPKPLPAGTYTVVVKGLPEYGESSQKKTPFVRFTYSVVASGDDVDEDDLREWATMKDGTVRSLQSATLKDTYYTTPDALFRLTDTMENMGIDLEGKTTRQCIDETPNAQLDIFVGHRASEDGQQIFAEVKRTMKSA